MQLMQMQCGYWQPVYQIEHIGAVFARSEFHHIRPNVEHCVSCLVLVGIERPDMQHNRIAIVLRHRAKYRPLYM